MHSEDFQTSIEPLRELGGQRVWSLMISLFGDMAQDKGDVIDGPVLSAVMALLQVKPEAVRVALHRLRNDGWIRSVKAGRISRHSLSVKGRAQSAAASPRIYAPPADLTEGWQMVVPPDNDAPTTADLTEAGFTQIAPRLFVGALGATPPPPALAIPGRDVPTWLKDQAEPAGFRQDYTALLETLTELAQHFTGAGQLTAIECATLRCLIVHNWRRLVLKHPALPGALMSPDWPGLRCHLLVADLLTRFPRPQLRDIEPGAVAA